MSLVEAVIDAPVHAHPVPASTILIVDDSPVNLQLLVRTLEGRGHRILAARSGGAALDIARRAQPDLVLLDVLMPDLNGFEVCRRMMAGATGSRRPLVIFLSALGDVADKVEGLSLGAVDYITKPIQPDEVLARVDSHLTRQYLERELRSSRDRLARELTSAGKMQQQLLPRELPVQPGLTFAAYYQTSQHAGGDYYDVIPIDDRRVAFFVADVSGHGAPAAIVMAMIRTVVHTLGPVAADPAAALAHINDHFEFLYDHAVFASAVCGVVDREARTVRLACAGHPLPLHFRSGEGVRTLACSSTLPLLMQPLGPVIAVEHALRPGDRVLLYTDGITEREAPSGDMFDVERLEAAFAASGGDSAGEAIAAIVAAVDRFGAQREPSDDQTLLLLALD